MTMIQLHVVPYNGQWALRWANSTSVVATYRTKEEAVAAGRQLARQHGAELVIHRLDGTIQERDSYGNDSYPPRG
ncbi:MAG: DUF2188 domain-containing protein [Anaerolineales bacterium]|nr:DUF2188 domain-containing protein [Anaerolineales bacterium]